MAPTAVGLDLDQLRDIIAKQGTDPSKLAKKWKSRGRHIDLILKTAKARLEEGDVFRVP